MNVTFDFNDNPAPPARFVVLVGGPDDGELASEPPTGCALAIPWSPNRFIFYEPREGQPGKLFYREPEKSGA